MLLAIDVGNTNTVIGLYDGETLLADLLLHADPVQAALLARLLRRLRGEVAGQTLHLLSTGGVLLDHLLGKLADFFILRFLLR